MPAPRDAGVGCAAASSAVLASIVPVSRIASITTAARACAASRYRNGLSREGIRPASIVASGASTRTGPCCGGLSKSAHKRRRKRPALSAAERIEYVVA
jgi:hypothetical protein